MKKFQELLIWQRSHEFTLQIYRQTKSFPQIEIYCLASQMRRSSSSIPTNIAEGCGRDSDAELCRFMVIAMGSASELEYQLILSKDLEYIDLETFEYLTKELIEIKKNA
ncbi:four helix bundle protein [Dyadobacter jejuensis]|uniref:Four helix bundle protein n=1 Tax=Dyadobacter jejuensis TaxID=1082580 RepID=A0A316A6S2_9BACT|nr:four helix bundle protein [Dyadobacter jejuensis]PWJ53581.1 four helix bundle protein [Dyadobacter jejuensis]